MMVGSAKGVKQLTIRPNVGLCIHNNFIIGWFGTTLESSKNLENLSSKSCTSKTLSDYPSKIYSNEFFYIFLIEIFDSGFDLVSIDMLFCFLYIEF